MKILVIGGKGFIGSNLCEALVEQGHSTTVLDNLLHGSRNKDVEGVNYIYQSAKEIVSAFPSQKFDIVFHLGEYSRLNQSFEDVYTCFNENSQLIHVLRYCKNTRTRLIYGGSSTNFVEKNKDYVQSPYAFTKMVNAELVKYYNQWFNIDYNIVYFYNVYGEGEPTSLISKYTQRIREGRPLPVVLPGTQIRNFTNINDVIPGLITVMENGSNKEEYGLGHKRWHSILEVANMFGGSIDYLPPRQGNYHRAYCDVIYNTDKIGWEAKINLKDYIKNLDLSPSKIK